MDYRKTIRLYYDYVIPSYSKTPLVLERGRGTRVWDSRGEEYLDFFPGWAVSGLGHCHRRVVEAVKRQAELLMHVSNNYYHEQQGLLAEEVIRHSFPGKVFFCNSGAEANEAAFKLVRKLGNPARNEIITMDRSFHGRTLGTIAATGQKKFREGFEPDVPGFASVPFNDFGALERAVTPKTIAVMLEPIQGEGGIRVADASYLSQVKRLCHDKKLYLIFDEVQTGMGRTGRMFCYKNYGVEPDVMTLAKSFGGGFPVGAMVARREIADVLQPGTHATTFGGSPLACAAALAVFEAIEKEKLLSNAVIMGSHLFKRLNELKKRNPVVRDVRGMALMAGVELDIDGKGVYEECLKRRLLINCTQGNVLRLMPPLVVKEKEIDRAVQILDEVLAAERESHGAPASNKEGSRVA
ncbi:MAG TPA: aspartate aminotransferase family protein [Candidatus Eisenbacteria bacterium]|jgi:predicted acetylornithine/succinylornithine family transaminase|nr:aspartate aminotransferase family protein [Candidatus Eisenbacteria bacterium]